MAQAPEENVHDALQEQYAVYVCVYIYIYIYISCASIQGSFLCYLLVVLGKCSN